jgi:hypothetical protein
MTLAGRVFTIRQNAIDMLTAIFVAPVLTSTLGLMVLIILQRLNTLIAIGPSPLGMITTLPLPRERVVILSSLQKKELDAIC